MPNCEKQNYNMKNFGSRHRRRLDIINWVVNRFMNGVQRESHHIPTLKKRADE